MKILCPKCGYRFHVATDELDNSDIFLCTNCTAVWRIELRHYAHAKLRITYVVKNCSRLIYHI